MKKKTKALVLVLIICMVITSIPAFAFAEEVPSQTSDSTETVQPDVVDDSDNESNTTSKELVSDGTENAVDEPTDDKPSEFEDNANEELIENSEVNLEVNEEPTLEDTLVLEEDVSEENVIDEESTEDMTVFDLGNGMKKAIFYGDYVRFEDKDGNLIDYEPELVEIENIKNGDGDTPDGYSYENKAGDSKQYIPDNLSEATPILLEKDDYQIKMTPLDEDIENSDVNIKSEEILTIYEQIEEQNLVAEYISKDETHLYEYTSLSNGLKESIILNEIPESNVFEFSLILNGLIPQLDTAGNVIMLKDKISEDVVAVIDRPFMNDATENAYSEAITYTINETVNENKYILRLTVDESYLEDESRVYPVTIDPTETWTGDSELRDVYVINGTYANTNFYDSGIRKMIAGKGSDGTSRTYIQLNNLKTRLGKVHVTSAKLTLYEYADCDANQTVRFNRVTENWSKSTVTWNNKPAYYTEGSINSFTTTGANHAAHEVVMTNFVRNILNDTNTNYGIVMRNVSSNVKYTEFYGSRTTATSYKPKFVVTFTDRPGTPTSMRTYKSSTSTTATRYFKSDEDIYMSWDGITSSYLEDVEYCYRSASDDTAEPTNCSGTDLTSYRSLGTSQKTVVPGSNVKIPNAKKLPEGEYYICIRGIDNVGITGIHSNRKIYIDKTSPTLTNVSVIPSASATNPTRNLTPKVSWKATDKYFSKVTVLVSGTGSQAITATTTAGTGSYTIPSGIIKESGQYDIIIKAYDSSGNVTSCTVPYWVDVTPPVISNAKLEPQTTASQKSNNARPVISFSVSDDGHSLSDTNQVIKIKLGDNVLSTTRFFGTVSYTLPLGTLSSSGTYIFTIEAVDNAGNKTTKQLKYYYDADAPVLSSFSIEPGSSILNHASSKRISLSFETAATDLAAVLVKVGNSSYREITDFTGNSVIFDYDFSEGSNQIKIKLKDNAGNTGNELSHTYYYATPSGYTANLVDVREYYGKRFVKWNTNAYAERNVRYELHRGTTQGFTPSENTLICNDLAGIAGTYIDKEIISSGTCVYKIKIVADTALNETSNEIQFTNIVDEDSFIRTNGNKTYLDYYTVALPNGTINAESSSGNLMYNQRDFDVSNAQLDYGFERTYQTKNEMNSMLGKGWNDSFHMEIYTTNGEYIFVDTDGSVYTFVRNNNRYVCEESKDYSLEISDEGVILTDKDYVHYRFNEYGQLIEKSESNGCTVTNVYNQDGLLVAVESETPNTDTKTLHFTYMNNSNLLESVVDLAGTIYEYSYLDNMLSNVWIYNPNRTEYVEYEYSYNGNGEMTCVKDGEGNCYDVTYSSGKVENISYPDGEYFDFFRDSNSVTVTRYEPSGAEIYNQITEFDLSTGKVARKTSPSGIQTTYCYYENNPYLLESEGTVKEYEEITGTNCVNVVQITDTVSYEYDDNENLLTEEYSDGREVSYEYSDNNFENLCTRETEMFMGELVSDFTYAFDEYGNIEEYTDEVEGLVEQYMYVDNGEESEISSLSDEENVLNTNDGNPVSVKAIEDNTVVNTTFYTYTDDTVMSVCNAGEDVNENDNRSSSNIYDEMGRCVESVENGVTTSTAYDFLGRAVETVVDDETDSVITTHYTYTNNNTLASESITGGVTKDYSYDSRNRKISETVRGNGINTKTSSISYGYESSIAVHNGITTKNYENVFKETETSFSGVQTVRYLDEEGRTVKEENGNVFTDYFYDLSGNQYVTYIGNEEDGNKTLTVLVTDEKGNAVAEISNPDISSNTYYIGNDSIITYQEYDEKGNITKETDGNGDEVTYSYDNENNTLIECVTAEENSIIVSYTVDDVTGSRTTTITDANGNQKEETVNAFDLVTVVRDIDGGSDNGNEICRTYEYDNLGRLTKESVGEKYIVYTYEGNSDRVQTETSYLSEDNLEEMTEYEYDSLGRLDTATKSDSNGIICIMRYLYDCEGNITSESAKYGSNNPKVTTYSYTPDGNIAQITYPVDSQLGTVTYIYDANGRISEIQNDGSLIREYIYDSLGRETELKNYLSEHNYILERLEYDSFGRVNDISYFESNDTVNTLEHYSYSFDKNGQIIECSRINTALGIDNVLNETREYMYDRDNRLVQSTVTNNLSGETVTTDYMYDTVGNRTRVQVGEDVINYNYNGLNQLMSSDTSSYEYDSAGNQVSEENVATGVTTENLFSVRGELLQTTVSSSDNSYTQENRYDHEGQRIYKRVGNSVKSYYYSNGTLAYAVSGNSVDYANLLTLEGNVIGAYLEGDYRVYSKDALNSTSSIFDEHGLVDVAYSYDDFGQTTEITGNGTKNEICYTGAVYDQTTGLYYLSSRYYDPETARFVSQDTYRGEIMDYDQWHLYVYCANNPINYVDPSGNWKVPNWLLSSIIDFGFSCFGVGAAFSKLSPYIKSAVKSGKAWKKAVKKIRRTMKKLKSQKAAIKRAVKFASKVYGIVKKSKVAKGVITIITAKLKDSTIDKVIKSQDWFWSIGSFITIIIDVELHDYVAGYTWDI